MPVVHPCSYPDCETLCMGDLCIEHEAAPVGTMPRGRPFLSADVVLEVVALEEVGVLAIGEEL
jgi:hypothetical protein